MDFGYVRVSTTEQNVDRQVQALTDAGIDPKNIYVDKISGVKESRPALDKLLGRLREGDSITVLSFDRLARSTKQLLDLSERFQGEGVDLISLHENIDTTTPVGKMFFTIISAIAEFQRNTIKEVQREGIAAAKASGRKLGRKPIDVEKVELAKTLYESGKYTVKESCKQAGISESVFYRSRRKERDLCNK